MHLRSLVLKGFKSFADRSALQFEPGITAVVGPNGSGKSNISDAVLWVLGERNAKNLRGQAMEDVIFAGSSARKSVGIAEVDLILDNSDGMLPVDYSEVVITRRMYRSGESEYLINGTIARRLDVLDILHDSGLGTGTHSIISQGSLDSVLQSKPEDRRALIEEAAGVLKHKQRKVRSERKLAQMDMHLTRVRDVAAEVERQLKPLERKAKRAQAYQGLASELADLNLKLAVDELRVLQGKWDEASKREEGLDAELAELRQLISLNEKEAEELQESMQKRNATVGELAARYRRAQTALERFDSTVLLLHEKRRSAQTYEGEIKVSSASNADKLKDAQEELDKARIQLQEAKSAQEEAAGRVEALSGRHEEGAKARNDLEEALQEARRKERALSQEIELSRAALAENKEALSNSIAHEKMIASHGKDLEAQLERAEAECRQAQEAADGNERSLRELAEREAAAKGASGAAFSERERAHGAYDEKRDALSLIASEIRGLEEVERLSESESPAYTWLMGNEDMFEAEIAPLSHVIKAPAGIDSLVERLLGNDLGALFVKDPASANVIADSLCVSGEEGELVLIPKKLLAQAGRAGSKIGTPLLDSLQYPKEYEDALTALLGDVYLCKSSDEALEGHRADRSGLRYATKEGFVIWPSGKIAVGMSQSGEESTLARRRRLEDLRDKHVRAEEEAAEAKKAQEAAEEALRAAQAESLRLAQELAQAKGRTEASLDEKKRFADKLESLKREYADLCRQRDEAKAALEAAQPTTIELEQRIGELAGEAEETNALIEKVQGEAEPLRLDLAKVTEELSEARLSVATLSERVTYLERVAEARVREIESIALQDEESRKSLLRKQLAQSRIEPLLKAFSDLSDHARSWTVRLEQESADAQDSSSGLHERIGEARKKAREAHDAFDARNSLLSEAKVDKGRLEIQVEAAIKVIVEDCKTPLETALALPGLDNRPEIEDEAFKLRRRIANMGTINPDAAAEYEQLKVRYDYMAGQLEDLASARRALDRIVRVIDERMRVDFVNTFEQVNLNFQEIFAVLFPGGSAELSLVDPEDPESSGVEVTAQPRGKRITKMTLMSGGEKSLTALALLFAVYRIRTTPFYILDEVEAALDDTNLRRLCAYLDSLRAQTQLILITHQRRTMELADVLYGVSMQADGVTRVVSQKLDRALKHAEG